MKCIINRLRIKSSPSMKYGKYVLLLSGMIDETLHVGDCQPVLTEFPYIERI